MPYAILEHTLASKSGLNIEEAHVMKLALAVIAIGIAALAFGCSDSSDTLTVEEYFAELDAIDAEVTRQGEEGLEEGLWVDIFEIEEPSVVEVKDAVSAFTDLLEESVDGVKDLEPPSEVETEHDNFVETGEDLIVVFQEGIDDIVEPEDAGILFFGEPAGAFESACNALVAAGEANGVTVSAGCFDDE